MLGAMGDIDKHVTGSFLAAGVEVEYDFIAGHLTLTPQGAVATLHLLLRLPKKLCDELDRCRRQWPNSGVSVRFNGRPDAVPEAGEDATQSSANAPPPVRE
jgi:hypothetical protein